MIWGGVGGFVSTCVLKNNPQHQNTDLATLVKLGKICSYFLLNFTKRQPNKDSSLVCLSLCMLLIGIDLVGNAV